LKAADIVSALVRVNVQALVPEQAPDQPQKTLPLLAAAVRVTDVPLAKLALQVCGQLIPGGVLVIIPEPVSVTLNTGAEVKFAAMEDGPFSVSVQDAVPVHAPDQPANEPPELALAIRVTLVPVLKAALQV
jgi:hypothetical protein